MVQTSTIKKGEYARKEDDMGKEAISPNQKYTKLKEEYSKEASYYASSVNKIGNIRLLIALIGLASTLYLHLHFIPIYTIISFLVFCSMFILLVVKHRTYIEKRDYARTLCSINEEAGSLTLKIEKIHKKP